MAMLLAASLPVAAAVLTGAVRSEGAQPILAPPSMSSPVTLQFFVADGSHVKKGDPVLRIDASSASAQLDSLRDKITLTKATNAKQLAALELKVIDAKLALVRAKAARDKAKVDAGIPKSVITALDYDKYQGAYESAKRDAALKHKDLAAAQGAVARQRKDGGLQIKKLQMQLTFFQAEVDSATVHAAHAGVVVHGFQNRSWNGSQTGRFRQGSMTMPGTEVGQVVSAGEHFSVRAWALQPDRRGLNVGQAVRVHFDALPGADIGGHIKAISAASQPRSEWGDGHYYRIDIALDAAAAKLALLPGMSVRVETEPKADRTVTAAKTAPAETLHATGELIAQRSWSVIPPRIRGLWQLNITSMAPDGTQVKKGQPLVSFAAGRLAQRLPAQQSELAEKKRARDKLRLQLADDQRTATLAVAKARADADKAGRKAQLPEQYVPGVKYKKYVIDRDSTRKILALTKQRAVIAAASRKAQADEADAQVAQAKRKVTRMMQSMAKLTIRAPRSGLFVHETKNDGSKIDTGDQVFFGSTVGSMPDMESLAVRAQLPERDLRRVGVGQPVQVILSGGASRTLDGHIAQVGQNVHSKSGAEPVPVVTLSISLDNPGAELKPGRSVRVDIPPASEEVSS